ncbi:succinyl-CoA synthetase subunit beta [Thermosipho sp. 1063]|uniref:succinate--CoA ligase subunit beta n=1 Tax=unclassified Thermosipho (in: thermotogales) TaxID=2676525 RepID=UPI0009494C29|nr:MULTISPECIES: succinate--CoA ligase subunit beta [unclassified Thermosipho (in: thermotogales)]ANQ53096.1 succinyl-CoA synthetase subunit beta [Thermosipho sp. 1070]APT71545.1 succinyl-CoA synthetase subunit beta [Thermosipho sp. 1063]OOC45621.1 succinyl-CoA synthetase [Thermosipho sp. 1074]
MKIHEFVGKRILKEGGISVPESYLISNDREIEVKFLPAVLKSQVLVGGRMKAGGILFAQNKDEFLKFSKKLLHKKIMGETPYGVLVEKMVNIEKEYYLSLYIDRYEKEIKILFSHFGGIDIEDNKDKIERHSLSDIQKLPKKIQPIVQKLHKIMKEKDLTLLEINPLVKTKEGNIMALDAVLHLDDNAIFRQQWAKKFVHEEYPFHFVKLDGDIGVIGCGAGIVMATMDAISLYGGKPANFLDLGGGADTKTTIKALELLKSLSLKNIVLNIFGGITKCDEIAKAIVSFKEKNDDIKLFVRITGTNENEAKKILKEHNIHFFDDMYEMIKSAVKGDFV